MKLKATIISLVSILVVGLTAILLYCFWPAIKGTVDNSKYYTQEELQKSYDKGFEDGCKTETELTGQVKYYKGLVDEYYIQVNTLNDEITMLTKNKKDYETQITSLETQKTNLQSQVDNLTIISINNETTIASLNIQITNLQNQVTNLTNSGEDKSEQIAILNNQITNLQNTIIQLNTTNELNTNTITSLNTQIANLNNQISEMTLISQNSQSQINALNNKITELQKSVTYYESYIASLENGEQVVATFEFDGSVYNIQIVNKGSKLAVTNPTSTTYKIFNGWTVNGETIDLNTYTISANTKIVADITYKYDIKFIVDETTYNSQIIIKNSNATLPTNPTKYGYEFDGWSLNGVDVITDIASKQVTENTTYVAVFTKLHTVTFLSEGQTISTQTIRNGSTIVEVPSITSTQVKIFNGWKVGGNFVDMSTYKIYGDTSFIADYTIKSFETMSWSEIISLSESGQASTYFNIGDEKTIKLSDNTEIVIRILGFNHDSLSTGSGKAGITFGVKYLYKLNNVGYFETRDYDLSEMNTKILPSILDLMPDELKNSIKTVTKNFYRDIRIQSFNTKVFLFSAQEIYGQNAWSVDLGSTQYDYYKIYSDNKLINDNNSFSSNYFLRDAVGGFYLEATGNGADMDSDASTQYIRFGFCI